MTNYGVNELRRKYLEFSAENGAIDTTIISRGNRTKYNLDNAVTVSTWNDMKNVFL